MKKLTKIFWYNVVGLLSIIVLLGGCSEDTNEKLEADTSGNNAKAEEINDSSEEASKSVSNSAINSEKTNSDNESTEESSSVSDTNEKTESSVEGSSENKSSSEGESNSKEDSALSHYSSQEIEYARVWQQLGPNQNIEELIVTHISAGTQLDPEDDIDVSYPQDVIRLTGTRIVDGIVTYSGNGDGTINVYDVPLRWYGGFDPPADLDKEDIRKGMEDLAENPKEVYVEPSEGEDIIKLIKKLDID